MYRVIVLLSDIIEGQTDRRYGERCGGVALVNNPSGVFMNESRARAGETMGGEVATPTLLQLHTAYDARSRIASHHIGSVGSRTRRDTAIYSLQSFYFIVDNVFVYAHT